MKAEFTEGLGVGKLYLFFFLLIKGRSCYLSQICSRNAARKPLSKRTAIKDIKHCFEFCV